MNKVMLLGRLSKDPEVRYSSAAEPVAVARYSLAVSRRYKKDGAQDVDFINIVAFGANGEFAEKYLKKGQMIAVSGRLQVRNWEDQTGNKRVSTEVIVEDQYFAESKGSSDSRRNDSGNSNNNKAENDNGFYPTDENIEDDNLPF
ncbi:MAG TPA: single-stranded DNA-binding protein [Clostridiales bacterium]|nr:MAG: single-stranded DNA-binding protein [Clostridiales bacterium GWD2_32_59]HAN10061.1 single-stranded DNA-binding protein [Clostridiales bacterium]